MLTSVLLPDSDRLKLDGFLVEDNTIIFILTAVQPDGQCPNCNHLSNSVHSHYRRAVTDLPWAGVPVRLRLHVRKFFCHNAQGARTIFTERLPTVVAPWARRSVRLTAQQRQLRLDCGGETGARISQRMGLPASADTILRSVRGGGMLAHPTPRVLGVDDWARRKGQTYGTLLVDLESHEPVDLLSGRTADVLAKWLREHPGVEIITRDRSREYADGAAAGAAEAVQVADRFHLLSNLREALEAVLVRQGVTLSASPFSTAPVERVSRDHLRHWAAHRPISGDRGGETQPNEVLTASTASSPAAQRYAPERAANRTRRKARYDEVIALHQQGLSQKAMAVRTGLSRKTIGSWLRSGMFPERAPTRKRNTLLARFEPYLRARC